jgi:NADPH2:quinone reductase
MRAVVLGQGTGLAALELVERPSPPLGAGEVRVGIRAAGVNFIDIYQRTGVYQTPVGTVLGNEGVGEVLEVGDGLAWPRPGDRVGFAPELGAFATEIVLRPERLVPIPDAISDEVAAAALLQGMTAQFLAESCVRLEPGQLAIVHAAAGGVGALLNQLLGRELGVEVLATASSPAKRSIAARDGAAHVADYARFGELARSLGGAHVVFDGVGKDTFDDGLASLRPRGTLVLFGAASGQVPPFDIQRLNRGGSLYLTRPSLAHYTATHDELTMRARRLFELIERGVLEVRIAETFPLTAVGEAQEVLAGRSVIGKLVIRID